mmetsp:Transcript_61331/g.138191  ORF Transcript_61331/g.138191 Transcript_61331/m.138191 type:complete len:200 (+) Transcript_61331:5996-6595(+)
MVGPAGVVCASCAPDVPHLGEEALHLAHLQLRGVWQLAGMLVYEVPGYASALVPARVVNRIGNQLNAALVPVEASGDFGETGFQAALLLALSQHQHVLLHPVKGQIRRAPPFGQEDRGVRQDLLVSAAAVAPRVEMHVATHMLHDPADIALEAGGPHPGGGQRAPLDVGAEGPAHRELVGSDLDRLEPVGPSESKAVPA